MAKMDYEKQNLKDRARSQRDIERWKEVKNTFVKATKAQKRVIRKYNMYQQELIHHLSKKMASSIISKYANKNGWKKK
jgi:hypothetical protein